MPHEPPAAPAVPAWTGMPRNVWALGLTSLLTDVSSEMVTSVLPLYVVLHLQWSPMAYGALDGAYQGIAAVVRLAGGVVADHWRSHKAVALVGYATSAVAKLGYVAPGAAWPALTGALVADRLGKGLRTAPRDALVAGSAPPGRLGAAFGLHRTMDAAGAAAGPAVVFGLLLLAPARFDVVFVVSFWVAVVGVAALAFLVDGRPAAGGDAVRRVAWSRAGELRTVAGYPGLLVAAVVLALASVSDAFLFLVAQRTTGLDASWMPLLFVGTQLVYFALAAQTGAWADRHGARVVYLCGHAALAVAYAWLVLGPTVRWAPVVVMVLLGAYYAATDGVLSALAARLVPADSRGTAIGLLTTGTTGGRAIAALAFGALWTAVDPRAAVAVFLFGLVIAVSVAARALPREAHPSGGET